MTKCRPKFLFREFLENQFFPVFVCLFLVVPLLRADDTSAEQTPEDLFKKGATAFQAKDYATASKDFESVLAMGPTGDALETILFSLAGTYFNQKNLPKAEEYFNRVLKEFPNGKYKSKALISLSQIDLQTNRKEEAAKNLKLASEGGGDLAIRAKMAEVSLMVEANRLSEAADILQTMLAGGIKDELTVQAAMELAEIQSKQGHLDDALHLLNQLQGVSNLVDNPLQLDILALRIGDGLLAKGEKKKALKMYAIVRPKAVVIDLQKERIATLQKQIDDNKAGLQTNPHAVMEVNAANAQLQTEIDTLSKVLDQFSSAPDSLVPVRIREAKAYDELNEKWETILIWETLLDGTTPTIREDGLFSIATAYVSLGRQDDATAAIDRYLAAFPNGKYASQAGYLKGSLALEAGNYVVAETVFGERLAKGDNSAIAADMQFLLANCQFAQAADPEKSDKYKQAIENYKKYLAKYPDGKFAAECIYRIPLSTFMLGDYQNALDGLEDYVKKYPNGDFIGDAGYRIALCYNAAGQYDEVLKRCAEWEKLHTGEVMNAEVVALEGDAYAAKNMPAESAAAYRRSLKLSDSDEVLQYSLFEASKQYQKINPIPWEEIEGMFTDFIEQHPKHPAVVAAILMVSRAKVKLGKIEEAKAYLAKNILLIINDRNQDAVEKLLTALAQACSKRPHPPLITTNATSAIPLSVHADASATPRPSPTPMPPYDAEADFAKYLDDGNVGDSPIARARLVYGRAQLAGFTRKPDRQKELMAFIYQTFPANRLSAELLADCGEIALQKGDLDKAETLFKELMTSFPKSELLEFAYCGLGEVALERNQPVAAIVWFDSAVTIANAEVKLADITYGKGRALLAQGKLDEAKKKFEEVAGNKDWRGEITAKALNSLGDVEAQRGDLAAATQYYQRVFVAYQRFTDEVITAYLKAADAFIKLNKPEIAAAHLREMLSKPKLAKNPRADEARRKLESLPAATPTPTSDPGTNTSSNKS